jgi:hypothetical protein
MRATMILPWRLSLSTGVWILSVFVLTLVTVSVVVADQPVREQGRQAVAPGDSVIFNRDMAGAYFIARPLKEQYDSLQKRVTALRTDIREAKIDSAKAHSQIAALQAELKELLGKIDATKLYIAGAKIKTQIETTTIPIARNDLLFIECENVEIQGWDRPEIECVLEKTVFDEDGTNFDNDLAGIKLHARKGTGNEFFGFYKEMAKRTGEKEKALWNGFIFKDYIDQELSYITVKGLTHDEGNRQIAVSMLSEQGNGVVGGDWRRHASLKLRVPKCRLVGVQGALGKFRARDLTTPLIVQGNGNRTYGSFYEVSHLIGSLVAQDIPIDHLDDIRGNVSVVAAAYTDNRRYDVPTTRTGSFNGIVYRNIRGDLKARFCKVELSLEQIEGRIDVENDFGNTEWLINRKLAQNQDHRIVTQNGAIAIHLDDKALGELKTSLFTECGEVHLAEGISSFKDLMFSTGEGDVVRRSWYAQVRSKAPKGQRDPMESFETFQRVADALYGRPRKPGVDVISRAGTITVTSVGAAKR